jgi:hypothetical protein
MRFAQSTRSWALLLGSASYAAPGLSPLPAVTNIGLGSAEWGCSAMIDRMVIPPGCAGGVI